MLSAIASIFSSGIIGSAERMAMELIETDKESAEAKALWIKTLDPNGLMRRRLSNFACIAYGFYLIVMTILLLAHAYGVGGVENAANTKHAAESITDLFMPITTAWGGIVAASFGVNATNVLKGK